MNCKTCTTKWACSACTIGDKPKVKLPCSKCGKRPAICKGKCRPCYNEEKYDPKRKTPKVQPGISVKQFLEVVNG